MFRVANPPFKTLIVLLAALGALMLPHRVYAKTLIPTTPVDRPFPSGFGFLVGPFTPECSHVILRLGGTRSPFDPEWVEIGRLAIAESASVAQNRQAGPEFFGDTTSSCSQYIGYPNDSNYDSNRHDLAVRYATDFSRAPAQEGCRLFGGAGWSFNGMSFSSTDDSARIVVTGLTPGESYYVTGSANHNECAHFRIDVADDTTYGGSGAWPEHAAQPIVIADAAPPRFDAAPTPNGGLLVRSLDEWATTSHLNALGEFQNQGVPFLNPESPDAARSDWASVTDPASGNVSLAFRDRGNGLEGSRIAMQRASPGGSPLAGWPSTFTPGARKVVDARGDQAEVALTRTSDGGAIMAWTDTRNSPPTRAWSSVSEIPATNPFHLQTADVDGDGKAEVIATQTNFDQVQVFRMTPQGLTTVALLGTGLGALASDAGDVNGDGKADIVTACARSTGLSLHLTTPTPFVFDTTTIAAPGYAHDVLLRDVNSDGKLDLIYSEFWANQVSVRFGSGSGTFGSATSYGMPSPSRYPYVLDVGDINVDGLPDIAVICEEPAFVVALRNLGAGTFGVGAARPLGGGFPTTVQIGQMGTNGNANAFLDVVTTTVVAGDPRFHIQYGATGAGNDLLAGGSLQTTLPYLPYDLLVRDFDADGYPDVAMAFSHTEEDPPPSHQVWWGSPSGPHLPTPIPSYGNATSLTAGDLDGDGWTELVCEVAQGVSPYEGYLRVFRNRPLRDVYALRVQADGSPYPGWPVAGRAVATDVNDVAHVCLAPDGADGAYIGWERIYPGSGNAWLQRITGAGAFHPEWPADSGFGGVDPLDLATLNRVRIESLTSAEGVPDGHGGVYVCLTERNLPSLPTAYVARFTGIVAYQWRFASAGERPQVVRLPDGGVQVVWIGRGKEVLTTRLSPTGSVVAPWPASGMVLDIGSPADSTNATIILSDSTHVMIAWSHDSTRVRRLALDLGAGTWASSLPVLGEPSLARQWVAGPSGSAYLVSQTATQIVCQRVDPGGLLGDPRPRIATLTDWRADQGGVVRMGWLPSPLERSEQFALQGGIYRVYRIPSNGGPRVLQTELVSAHGCSYWTSLTVPAASVAGIGGIAPRAVYEIEVTDPSRGLVLLSQRDSVYSFDDLRPPTPGSFTASYAPGGTSTFCSWLPVGPDVARYDIHRASSVDFEPSPGNRVLPVDAPATSGSVPSDRAYYYKIVAVDVHGNASAPGAAPPVLDAGQDGSIRILSFSRPLPSPARERAALQFTLPELGPIDLAAYDVLGRRVRNLRKGVQAAGKHDVVWDLRDDSGRRIASGLYVLRLRAQGRSLERRLMVIH